MHTSRDANILIAGLGKTGLSVARHLHARGVAFAVADTREAPNGWLEICALTGAQIEHAFGPLNAEFVSRFGTIILSPGLPLADPAIQHALRVGCDVIGDIELFVRQARAPIVAITGANGKSTTTDLCGHLLRAAGKRVGVGGNIGTPALDLLNEPVPDVYVLELSSFQLETTHSLRAAAASLLNISEDHMDRYADLEAYTAAKARIYKGAECAVINADDPLSARGADKAASRRRFSIQDPLADYHLAGEPRMLMAGNRAVAPLTALKIRGEHNAANALAALALCEALGVRAETLAPALCSYAGLPHRCRFVRERHGVAYYNDSKATNVGAALAAVAGLAPTLQGKLVLIAGGDAKGQDLAPLTPVLAQAVRHLVLLGKDADALAAIAPETLPITQVASIEEAVRAAAEQAQAGDAVLLSPACASLDMFRNYEERGDRFAAAVEALP